MDRGGGTASTPHLHHEHLALGSQASRSFALRLSLSAGALAKYQTKQSVAFGNSSAEAYAHLSSVRPQLKTNRCALRPGGRMGGYSPPQTPPPRNAVDTPPASPFSYILHNINSLNPLTHAPSHRLSVWSVCFVVCLVVVVRVLVCVCRVCVCVVACV